MFEEYGDRQQRLRMKIIKTEIEGLLLIEPQIFEDNRGFFMESYSKEKYMAAGIECDFIQDNHSLSVEKGTVRGMHFQRDPKAQSKLIRVIRGEIFNVVVDLRKESQSCLKWQGFKLSAENRLQLFVPKNFANGFCSLTSNCEVEYKVDELYSPEHESGFLWNDTEINIKWDLETAILSEKDKSAPLFKDLSIEIGG